MPGGVTPNPFMLAMLAQQAVRDPQAVATLLAQKGMSAPEGGAFGAGNLPFPIPTGPQAAAPQPQLPQGVGFMTGGGGGAGAAQPQQGQGLPGGLASAFEAVQAPQGGGGQPTLPPVAPRGGGQIDPRLAALIMQQLQPQVQQPQSLADLLRNIG